MNKGSFWYLKWGFKNTIEILIKNIGNYFKYYIFLLAYLLSAFFIFPYPIFAYAHFKIIQMIAEKKDISLIKAFEGIDESKRYSKFLFTLSIIFFVLLGMICFCLLFAFLICLFIFCIPHLKTITIGTYIILILTAILIMVPSIYLSLCLHPIPFIISEEPQSTVSEVFKTSFEVTTGRKKTLFIIQILVSLCSIVFAGIFIGFYFLLNFLKKQGNVATSGIMIVAGIFVIFLILFVLLFPFLNAASEVSCYFCIQDGMNYKKETESKEDMNATQLLKLLFEEEPSNESVK